MKDETILVTGGFGRLGKALAQELERKGAVPILTSRTKSQVSEFNDEMKSEGRAARAVVLSFESPEETRSVAAEVVDRFGSIHGLVNGAYAALDYRPVGQVPWSHWEDSARVALGGAEALSAALVDARERSGIKSIVNISSIYGLRAPEFSMYAADEDPSAIYYGAIKAGVLALTRYLAALWGHLGVRVNAVTPGGILEDQSEDFLSRYGATVPMGRMVTGAEVSASICFLLEDESSGVTGANIVVDGGKVIR